jgi:hypothetical protein
MEIEEDDLEEMELGDPWDCEACGSHLRVASLEPLEFDGDDEDEDEDEDDDDAEESDDELDEDDDTEDDEEGGGGDWDE